MAIDLNTLPGTLLFFSESVSFRKQLPKVARKMKEVRKAVGDGSTYAMLQEMVSHFTLLGKAGNAPGFDWDDSVLDYLSKMLLYWALLPPPSMAFSWLKNPKLRSFVINDPDFKTRMRETYPNEADNLRGYAERLDNLVSALSS